MALLLRTSLILLFAVVATGALANDANTLQKPPAATIPQAIADLVGETLNYDIGFLWIDRLAKGKLTFQAGERPREYHAELEAKTLGVASWLSGDRIQRYRTTMELLANGHLRTISQESLVVKGTGGERREKGKRYLFDYGKQEVRVQRLGADPGDEAILPMGKEEQPNDFLTAFYNFRVGNFGPLRAGSNYTIPTFTRKGPAEITVRLLTDAERPEGDYFARDGLLARIQLDPEVLDTGGGAVYLWFDSAERPARGVVENVLGLGNVRGVLLSN